jgi:hypothetical protein
MLIIFLIFAHTLKLSPVKVLALLLFLLGLGFLDLRMDGTLWGKAGRMGTFVLRILPIKS